MISLRAPQQWTILERDQFGQIFHANVELRCGVTRWFVIVIFFLPDISREVLILICLFSENVYCSDRLLF